jgi:hypothetical protein
MAEVDTSSYPKAALPVSPLDVAGKVGSLQQQKLAIDQAKLDQANQALGYMTRAMGSLGPNATIDQYVGVAANAVKMGLVPENMLQTFVERAKSAPNSQEFYKQFMSAAVDQQQQIAIHTGVNAEKSSGAVNYQGKTDVLTGGFKPATQMPVQLPPGAPFYEGGQAKTLGPAGPEGVQPAQPAPRALPVAPGSTAPIVPNRVSTLPVERPVSGPTGPTIDRTPEIPTTLANRMSAGFNAAPPPMFEEGKKTLAENQLRASGLMQNAKPAIQALKIMKTAFPDGKTLATGPGTKQFNDLVATAKAWGVTDTKAENDPTVLRQELEKKLAQFVGTSPIASRSDAAQTLAEASSPNPKTQLLPALINLTRDAVALSRVEAAKALTFKGSDYSKVGEHIANFPQSIDEKAFGLDMMDEKERDSLVKKMVTQYQKGDAREKKAAGKFLDSLKMAKELDFY